ncbi:MAG: tripartite tricarboxylate transporter permease [Alphaproteobacteria bacterium]|nr:tripartite tricarboxylate transporter permease [Alphaproteobacteria bacterium]
MFEAALQGFVAITAPVPLGFLVLGVCLGVWGGALPGVGGPAQLAVLLPFAMLMEPINGIAFLIGVTTVGNTGNTFTSVLMAVPGGSGSQATVLDGYPMAQKGEARRALSAAFMVSMIGGIIGALMLFGSLPIMRPLVRSFGSPELFMFTIWGLSMIGTMSSGAPLKGLSAAILGVILSTVGQDVKSGVIRFDFDEPYLWGGVSIVLISLSIFAIPEMIALAARKGRVAEVSDLGEGGILEGIKDAFRHKWLVLRSAAVGTWVGVLPGLGSDVADWFAYASAKQTEKNTENFGKGDVRGVIAPESSNNAKEGGALITTLAFGIPGSTSMALLLIAFMSFGLNPGPDMISDPAQLYFVYAIIAALALSQILASGICWAMIKPAARICFFPFYVLVPVIVALTFLSAFSAHFSILDIVALLGLSLFGYFMKVAGWPRAPVVLGFVLGDKVELYLWLSVARYDMGWIWRPGVLALGTLIAFTLLWPMWKAYRAAPVPKAPEAAE